jgi:hypothetical protein
MNESGSESNGVVLTQDNLTDPLTRYRVLQEEIHILQERVRPTDTGHIRTTINQLIERCEEIENQFSPEIKTWVLLNKK